MLTDVMPDEEVSEAEVHRSHMAAWATWLRPCLEDIHALTNEAVIEVLVVRTLARRDDPDADDELLVCGLLGDLFLVVNRLTRPAGRMFFSDETPDVVDTDISPADLAEVVSLRLNEAAREHVAARRRQAA